jgi:hypothetical protein
MNSNIIQYHDQRTLVHWTKLVLTGSKCDIEMGSGEVSNEPLNPQ